MCDTLMNIFTLDNQNDTKNDQHHLNTVPKPKRTLMCVNPQVFSLTKLTKLNKKYC